MSRLLIWALTTVLATTGCAAKSQGQPVPAPGDTSTPPSTSQSRSGKAPPINSPELDLASFESRVCDLLTPEQLAPLAIRDAGKARDGENGPACTWNPPNTSAGARIDVAILSKAQNGWEGVYERKDNFVFFDDAGEINGYPAVHRDITTDRTKGRCATTVGVRRDLVFDVGVFVNGINSPEYKNACSVSDRVASLVIDTLKKGGR